METAAGTPMAAPARALDRHVLTGGGASLHATKPVDRGAYPSMIDNLENPDEVVKTVLSRAKYAADLRRALDSAEAEFSVAQAEMRDYGVAKRAAYNRAFRANVTTVEVPYCEFLEELPRASKEEPARHAPAQGQELRVVQVICSNKYSVAQDTILQNRDRLGDDFERLFKIEETRTLKPNAQDLLQGVFAELGIEGEQLTTIMEQLFERKVKVFATETYEQEVQRLPDDVQALLAQMVTRAQPGLKFVS